MRVVSRFSCGAASAVATKVALAEYGHESVEIVNAFIKEEHVDNRRFLADCVPWFQHDITVLADKKYEASTDVMWLRKRFIIGHRNVPCSAHLKHELLDNFSAGADVHVFGFTAEEMPRFARFQRLHPDWNCVAPLIDRGLTKSDCLAMVERAGILMPITYRMGYDNANCIGCPKGGQGYHQAIREDFPERHARLVQIQKEIGPGSYFLRFRSGPRKGERMPLWELPEGRGNMKSEPSFSCSFFCELAEEDIAKVTRPAELAEAALRLSDP